jgi:DnaJ family protein C protein 2
MALTLALPLFSDIPAALVASSCPLPRSRHAEVAPFGAAYVRWAFPLTFDAKDKGSAADSSPSGRTAGARRDMGDRKKNVKLDEADLEVDWYDLLKLPNGEGASDDEIKAAYRRRCLETHPDKQPDGSDVLFKRVQRAFEILGNPEARRSFDSSRPFDDAIPPENVKAENFFKTFGPAFERNKKWSAVPNMPSLGDDDLPVADVKRMYDEWLAFRSWRDFSNEVELQEIDEGMMREEKRFYQRENQRMLDKMNRDELKRVRALVDRAMKNDPRLRRQRDAEDAARQAQVAQKAAAKAEADEKERQSKIAAAEREQREKEEKKQTEINQKNRLRNAIKGIADFFKEHNLVDDLETNKLLADKIRKPNVQWLTTNCTVEEAEAAEAAIRAGSTAVAPGAPPAGLCEDEGVTAHVPSVIAFNKAICDVELRVGRTRYGRAIKASTEPVPPAKTTAAKPTGAKEAIFTEEELVNLQRLAIKYPGGCVDRWRHIATGMHDKFTEEQILEKVKELENKLRSGKGPAAASSGVPDAPSAPVADEWTPKQQKQLEQGLREMQSYKEKDKFNKVAAFVDGKTAKQCFDRFKLLCEMRKTSK